jgi:hypothetical protein
MRSGHRTPRWVVGGTITAGTVGAILAFTGAQTPARVPLVLLSLIAMPAVAVAELLPALDPLSKVVVAGSAALVINVAVAAGLLVAGAWSPTTGLVAVLVISAGMAVVRLLIGPPSLAATGRAARP